MRSPSIQTLSLYRFLIVSALAVATIVTFGELGLPFLSPNATIVSANVEASTRNSTLPYRWNLDDARLPLLSLPEQIRGSVDLSITYSMDQFQFPLFQSLYYNERAGKYLLMVMPKGGGRAEFIELARVKGANQFEAKANSSLRLEDKGYAKLLTTGEGTVYTFAPLGNGEFHCSQIKGRDGEVINLKYTTDASIATISDNSGRRVSFGYEKDYVSSITQTWGRGTQMSRTWAIGNDAPRATQAVHFVSTAAVTARPIFSNATSPAYLPTAAVTSKRIPLNALIRTYTPAMAASDSLLASIFGGSGAVAAAHSFEPVGLGSQYPLYRGDVIGDNGKLLRGHLSYAMHLYGNVNGTGNTDLYVPAGFTSHSNVPTPTDAAVTFYYPRLGNLTNVTLAVFHVANFHLSPEGARVRIGNIGGRGGSIAYYKHSHLEFYRGNTGLPASSARPRLRIDPASVFSSTSNLAYQSGTNASRAY